mmetsp:Transcript_22928/g.58606  ORF Transcript_22928/g.58606 Transcript_22928/m.58606 type:complete len:275 (+) Transcript_22928:254-1078(+)
MPISAMLTQQPQRTVVMHVRVKPEASELLAHSTLPMQLGRHPRARDNGSGGHAADQRSERSPATGEADVQLRMPNEHAAVDESRDGQRRLQVEADDDVQLEAAQTLIAGRAVDATGRRVQEERYVEVHAERVERVQALVIQRDPEVSADVAAQKSELLYRTFELLSCQLRALHGQGGHAHEAALSTRHELGQPIVVLAAESCSLLGLNVVKVCQRIRGQHLEIDAIAVHPLDPRVSIHEGAATILHVVEVVIADSVPGLSISLADLGAVGAGGT